MYIYVYIYICICICIYIIYIYIYMYDMAQLMGGGVTLKTQSRDINDSGKSGDHILSPDHKQ